MFHTVSGVRGTRPLRGACPPSPPDRNRGGSRSNTNSKRDLLRLDYRQKEWDVDFLIYLRTLDKQKPVIICGDLNVAHTEIDLANPKSNRRNAGFTEEERAGLSNILNDGFVDTFREFEKGPGHYTWWTYRNNARERNIGWRLDYFLVSDRLKSDLESAQIMTDVHGSDHCPVNISFSGG